jgi:hypothetical protein
MQVYLLCDLIPVLAPLLIFSPCVVKLATVRNKIFTVLQAGRSGIRFFNWLNPSSHIMALGSTELLREMSIRNLPGGKGRPARKADNLIAISEPTV